MRSSGVTLAEALVVTVLVGLAVAVSIGSTARARSSVRTAAGTRSLAILLFALRWKSVVEGRGHGLYFVEVEDGWTWYEVRDGNANGLRVAEVRDGTDPTLSGPHRIAAWAPSVDLGFPEREPLPRIPPRRGRIERLEDPIRFGRADLIAFSAAGGASSGTLYVTDGRSSQAVVLYGRTGRIRVWSYDEGSDRWRR